MNLLRVHKDFTKKLRLPKTSYGFLRLPRKPGRRGTGGGREGKEGTGVTGGEGRPGEAC